MDSIWAFLVKCSPLSCKTLTFEVSWAWLAGSPRFRPKSYQASWEPGGAARWLQYIARPICLVKHICSYRWLAIFLKKYTCLATPSQPAGRAEPS